MGHLIDWDFHDEAQGPKNWEIGKRPVAKARQFVQPKTTTIDHRMLKDICLKCVTQTSQEVVIFDFLEIWVSFIIMKGILLHPSHSIDNTNHSGIPEGCLWYWVAQTFSEGLQYSSFIVRYEGKIFFCCYSKQKVSKVYSNDVLKQDEKIIPTVGPPGDESFQSSVARAAIVSASRNQLGHKRIAHDTPRQSCFHMQPASLQALNSSWCSTLANTFNTNQRKLVTKTSTFDGPRSKVWQQVSFCSSQLCLRWKKNWETQVTGFHVWSVLNLGLYIQKDVSTLITDHVSFSSCYVLLLKKHARFYDLVTSRAFHQDAILTHTAALALQAPDISTIRNISATITTGD